MRRLLLLFSALLGSSAADAQLSPFVQWEQAVEAQCARTQTGDAVADMSSCAARKIEKALADGLVPQSDVDRCLTAARQRRGRGSPELAAWSTCGLKDAVSRALRPASTATAPAEPALQKAQFIRARVERLDLRATATGGSPLAPQSWRRADIVPPLYAGRFTLLPNKGLDNLRYYSQLPQDLARLCPELQGVPDFVDALPYAFANFNETLSRTRTGDVSTTETAQLILMFGQVLTTAGQDCDKVPDYRRDACEAGRDPKNSVLPSVDAQQDAQLLVRAHGCRSPQVQRFTGNLASYFRSLRLDGGGAGGLPAPDTPAGAAYLKIFEQCARQAGGGAADAWCGCHVRDLHERHGGAADPAMLSALAADPFVDFSFGLRPDGSIEPPAHIVRHGVRLQYPRLGPRSACAQHVGAIERWRESTPPRTTACLEQKDGPGPQRCTYRTTWGVFQVEASPQCPALIDSRVWGAEELQCRAGSPSAALSPSQVDASGMRRHRNCPGSGMPCTTVWTLERDVPPGFVPPMPALKPDELPLVLSIPQQQAAGSLIGLTVGLDESSVQSALGDLQRQRPEPERRAFFVDIYRVITEDKALVLACRYRGETQRLYWYGSVPRRVAARDFSLQVGYHPLLSVASPRTWCPASAEPLVAVAAAPPVPTEPPRPTPTERAEAKQDAARDARLCAAMARNLEKAREAARQRPSSAAERRVSYSEEKYRERCETQGGGR